MPDAPQTLIIPSPPRLTYAQAASLAERGVADDVGLTSSSEATRPGDGTMTVAADTDDAGIASRSASSSGNVNVNDEGQADGDHPSTVLGDTIATFELDEEEDELFLFQESLRRGAAAQIRRRLLTRPRDSLIRQAAAAASAIDGADEPPSLLVEQLNWVSARSLALQDRLADSSDRMRALPDEQPEVPETILYGEIIDDGIETFIDPRTLHDQASPSIPPHYNRLRRGLRPRTQRSSGAQDSIFFHSAPQTQDSVSVSTAMEVNAALIASSTLAAQLNAPPQVESDLIMFRDNSAAAPAQASRQSNLEVLQRSRLQDLHRASTSAAAASACGKPVLLLYCSADGKPESQSLSQSSLFSPPSPLPEGWYRPAEERDDASTSTVVVKPDSGVFDARFIGGGGCGRLLCARGSTTAEDQTVETDTAPIPQNVGWLESIDDPITIASGAQRWQGCRCLKVYIGCRHCGNGVGYGIITQCKRCSNAGRTKHKWVFAASTVETRPRVIAKSPPLNVHDYPAELAQDACERNTVMRWVPSALPTREQDRQHGLAGDEAEWSNSVSQIMRRTMSIEERTHTQAASQRSMSFGMPLRTQELIQLRAETTPLLLSPRLEQVVDEVADDLDLPPLPPNHPAPMAPRALLLSRVSGLSPPALANADNAAVESARTADIIYRTRALRRNLREFLSMRAGRNPQDVTAATVSTNANAIPSPLDRQHQMHAPNITLSTGRRRRRRSLSPSMREMNSDVEDDIFRRSPESLTPAQAYAESVRRDHRRRRLLELLRSEASDGPGSSATVSTTSAARAQPTLEMVGR